ncbi:MAG: hypothetical protein GY847_41285 [Proteobacteria bacterium]|nr:hypothetical protein [Pseudomonadota bacterium]
MSEDIQKQITSAERLIRAGDYREARALARELKTANEKISKEDTARVERILAITGMDPFVIAGFLITFGIVVFLFMKYVF